MQQAEKLFCIWWTNDKEIQKVDNTDFPKLPLYIIRGIEQRIKNRGMGDVLHAHFPLETDPINTSVSSRILLEKMDGIAVLRKDFPEIKNMPGIITTFGYRIYVPV